MAKTLQAALKARQDDPRALRATLSLTGGRTHIILPAVGRHARTVIAVSGDTITLVDDRPVQTESAAQDKVQDAAQDAAQDKVQDETQDAARIKPPQDAKKAAAPKKDRGAPK
jgi:6-phosphogluconolactonase/glucosamine-6-phosphate isomerase/deaminase